MTVVTPSRSRDNRGMRKAYRLQVVLDEDEMAALHEAAAADGLTVSEWVRSALRAKQGRRHSDRTDEKLEALQRALTHEFPAPNIDQMLDDIALGRSLPE